MIYDIETQKRWLGVFLRAYGVKSCFFRNNDTQLACGLVQSPLFGSRLCSLPYVTYGGLFNPKKENNDAVLRKTIAFVESHRIKTIEIHGLKTLERASETQYAIQGWYVHEIKNKVTFWCKFANSPEEQWKALDAKVRNQIRKAEKSGLTVKICGEEGLKYFYQVHARNMRDLGSPPHSKKFFREVANAFGKEIKIFCVYLNQKVVAASLAVACGKELLEVPWAGNDKRFARMCPNMLLYWAMIKHGAENRFEYFDFGRCTIGSGTYQFKKQWGAEEKPIYWYLLTQKSATKELNLRERLSLSQKIWSQLPLWLANWMGPWVRRQITL